MQHCSITRPHQIHGALGISLKTETIDAAFTKKRWSAGRFTFPMEAERQSAGSCSTCRKARTPHPFLPLRSENFHMDVRSFLAEALSHTSLPNTRIFKRTSLIEKAAATAQRLDRVRFEFPVASSAWLTSERGKGAKLRTLSSAQRSGCGNLCRSVLAAVTPAFPCVTNRLIPR